MSSAADSGAGDGERLLTVAEVADHLRVTDEAVRRYLRRGELRGIPLGGPAGWRVRPSELERFLAERERRGGDARH